MSVPSFANRYRFEDFIDNLDRFMKLWLHEFIDQMNTDLTDIVLLKPHRQAKVVTVTPTAVNSATYTVTIKGTAYQYIADSATTPAEIVTGLSAVVNAHSDCLAAATGTTTLILTAKVPGVDFSVSVGANLAAVVTTVNDHAFFFQTIEADINRKVFLYYGEVGTESQSNGPEEAATFKIQVGIMLENGNQAQGITGRTLLRYRDCLNALFNQGWNSVSKRVKVEVSGLSPFPFSMNNQDATHVGIGVELQLTLP